MKFNIFLFLIFQLNISYGSNLLYKDKVEGLVSEVTQNDPLQFRKEIKIGDYCYMALVERKTGQVVLNALSRHGEDNNLGPGLTVLSPKVSNGFIKFPGNQSNYPKSHFSYFKNDPCPRIKYGRCYSSKAVGKVEILDDHMVVSFQEFERVAKYRFLFRTTYSEWKQGISFKCNIPLPKDIEKWQTLIPSF